MGKLIDTDLLADFGTKFKDAYEAIFSTETTKKYAVNSANWSASTVTVNNVAYYTLTIELETKSEGIPTVGIAPSGDNTLPTEAENTEFAKVKHMTIDNDDHKTLKIYATEKPQSTFYIYVRSYRY